MIARCALWLVLAFGLALYGLRAEAQEVPTDAYYQAKDLGRLPPWASIRDQMRLQPDWIRKRMYLCLVDSVTGARWTTWAPFVSWHQFTATGRWTFGETVPTTPEDEAFCFPPPG